MGRTELRKQAKGMPADYKIVHGVAFVTALGELTVDDVKDIRRRLAMDKDFDPGGRVFIDLSAVDRMAWSVDDVRGLVGRDPYGSAARRAIVAPADHVYGLTRMYEMLSEMEDKTVRVFRDGAEARSWLGLEEPDGSTESPVEVKNLPL